MSIPTVLIIGNTFPVKDQIKALGARWDPEAKGWRVPAARAAEAQRLVSGAGKSSFSAPRTASRGTRTGCRCGSIQEYSRPSDCWTCKHDAE